jgi:hypothetical protein
VLRQLRTYSSRLRRCWSFGRRCHVVHLKEKKNGFSSLLYIFSAFYPLAIHSSQLYVVLRGQPSRRKELIAQAANQSLAVT